jgi:parvulin-like peptidyl-prolyl isomerase
MKRSVAVVLVIAISACADLTAPSGTLPAQEGGTTSDAAANPAALDTAALRPVQPAPPAQPQPGAERARASHILIAYQGATRSSATRSKDEAKKLAEQLLARVRTGQDFAKLASDHSDDPTAKARGGDLGFFDRTRMVKPFADAAFALKPGEVSAVVETEFGFHVIKRTE